MGLLSPARDRTDPAAQRQQRKEHGAWSRLLGAGETVLEVFRLHRSTLVFTSPDADLRLWVAGRATPLERSFGPEVDVYAVQALIVQYQHGS